jgi:hypothetical protein
MNEIKLADGTILYWKMSYAAILKWEKKYNKSVSSIAESQNMESMIELCLYAIIDATKAMTGKCEMTFEQLLELDTKHNIIDTILGDMNKVKNLTASTEVN